MVVDAALTHPALGALQSLMETVIVEGFEHVVDGFRFEGLDGVLVEGGDEHDEGALGAELLRHLDAVWGRHLDVQEDQLRVFGGDEVKSRTSVLRFPHQLDLRIGFQELAESLASQGFVVDEEGADGLHVQATGVASPLSADWFWVKWTSGGGGGRRTCTCQRRVPSSRS